MLSDVDVERYARQIVLPEVGGRGQERLLASRVRVFGGGVAGRQATDLLRRAGVALADAAAEPSVIVDLRLGAPAAKAAPAGPLLCGRLWGTCATLDVLPAGADLAAEPPAHGAPPAVQADALFDCLLRALGALAAGEALVVLMSPTPAARRITIDLTAGVFTAAALEAFA